MFNREASPAGPRFRPPMGADIMLIEINPAPGQERLTVQTPRQSLRPEPMPGGGYLKFRNDRGIREICIGVREFKCIGESPPQDHPHVYIKYGPGGRDPLSLLRDAVSLRSSIDTARSRPAGQFIC